MKTKHYAEKLKRHQTVSIENFANYFVEYMDEYLPSEKKSPVLEVGSGLGNLLLVMKGFGYTNVEGYDIDDSNIDFCKKLNLNVKNIDLTQNNKSIKKQYDLIYAFDLIEHIDKEKTIPFLKNTYNLLSEKGSIVIKTQNMQNPFNLLSRYKDFTHTVGYTPDIYRQLMDETEISSYTIKYGDGYAVYDHSIVKRVIKFLFKVVLRILDLPLQIYYFFFLGGTWLNMQREIFLIIRK